MCLSLLVYQEKFFLFLKAYRRPFGYKSGNETSIALGLHCPRIPLTVHSKISRSAKPHDVILLPYTRVQIAHARYVHALLLAVRDKMAADFLLMFVKLPEHCAYFLQTLVDRSLKK